LTTLKKEFIFRHMTILRQIGGRIGGVDSVTRIGKALDHPLRVRALAALRHGELCVCELVALFGLAPSTISKHMSVIADAGLVDRRREGKWTYYSLPDEAEDPAVEVIRLLATLIDGDPVVSEDTESISRIQCRTEEHGG
jgi:DNA-binding transcriptional ArsR family regulator